MEQKLSHIARTLVVGLGNPILSDDGIGVCIVRALETDPPAYPNQIVHFTEAAVGGIRLMEILLGYDRAVIVDAWIAPDLDPGEWKELSLDDLREETGLKHTSSAHDVSLPTAIDAARRMGLHLPDRITLFGVGVGNVVDFGETLTPAVAEVIPELVDAIRNRLRESPDARPSEIHFDHKPVYNHGFS